MNDKENPGLMIEVIDRLSRVETKVENTQSDITEVKGKLDKLNDKLDKINSNNSLSRKEKGAVYTALGTSTILLLGKIFEILAPHIMALIG